MLSSSWKGFQQLRAGCLESEKGALGGSPTDSICYMRHY